MAKEDENRTRRAGKLLRDSAVQTALRQFWLWLGGKVWAKALALGGLLLTGAWYTHAGSTLQAIWNGPAIGFLFCLLMLVLSVIASFLQRRASRRNAGARYTSDGLDTRTLGTSPTSGSGNVTTIVQVLPSGTELPQPLALRVECSRDLNDGWATFSTDTKVLNTTKRLPPIRADIKEGKIAYFELLEPKLRTPAMLCLNLMWHQARDDEEITVLVTRRE